MNNSISFSLVLVLFAVSVPLMAQEPGVANPNVLVKETLQGMPVGKTQEVQVLTATLKAGDQTLLHTHRFPVTLYILEGAFTLEMEGRAPVTVEAGQAMVEPPHVKMTGYNRSSTEPLRVVIFYVSDPGTPFFDIIH